MNLITKRCLIRELTMEDADDLHKVLSDERVMRYIENVFDLEKTINFIRAAGLCKPPLVFGLAYTWVEWLEYNIQRALGECMDEAERTLGIAEVKNTIGRIKYIHNAEKEIKAVLEERLPEIVPAEMAGKL